MIGKNTYSRPIVWDPDTEEVTEKQLSSSGREVVNLKMVASGAAATVFLYDTETGAAVPNRLKWVMDSSQQDTDGDNFSYGLSFKKGIYAVLMSGAGFRPILCLSVIHDQV